MGQTLSSVEDANHQRCLEKEFKTVDWQQEHCNLDNETNSTSISIKKFSIVASKNLLCMNNRKGSGQRINEEDTDGLRKKNDSNHEAVVKLCVEIFQKKKQENLKFKTIPINLSKFTKMKKNLITDDYQPLEEIGQGSFGKVYKVRHIQSNDLKAMKKINKWNISENRKATLANEFNILKKIDHPNIIKLYDLYEDQRNYYVITEICQGGPLLNFVNDYKLSNTVLKCIIVQIISALNYLHSLEILHRDIKLENIVLVKTPNNYLYSLPELKIIDFGVSLKLTSPRCDEQQGLQGTLMYMPPESLNGQLSLSWDVWSLGILLFIMVTGKLPYKAENVEKLASGILDYNIQWKYTKKIDREVRYFLKKCLTKDWKMRPSVANLKQDPWLKEHKDPPLTQSKRRQTILHLTNYQNENNLVSYIQNYLSSKKTKQKQRQKLGLIFNSIDTNKDGHLSREQLKKFCLDNGEFYYQEEIDQIFKKVDTNNSNKIQFHEFIVMMQERRTLFDKQSIQETFQLFDVTRKGKISKTRMRKALQGAQSQEINYLFTKLNSNSNDQISKQQFINYLTQYQNTS